MNTHRAVAACVLAALAACAGPSWTVAPPPDTQVFLDGRREPRLELPARYYGTTTIDAVPTPTPELDRFTRAPERRLTTHDEPVTPWLFPLDFPLECLVRLFAGTPPLPLDAAVQENTPPPTGFLPSEQDLVRARAFAARSAR